MPIESFHGEETYVAYLDISGFKKLMNRSYQSGSGEAIKLLNFFYDTIIELTQANNQEENKTEISVMMFSDSAILFARKSPQNLKIQGILDILILIEKINKKLFLSEFNVLTTSSISYGDLHYERTDDSNNLSKSFLYGRGYASSYLNNEEWKPKIRPGQCRISMIDLPKILKIIIDQFMDNLSDIQLSAEQIKICKRIKQIENDHQNYYFVWFAKDEQYINKIFNDYDEAKYIGYRKIIYDELKD